MTDIDHAAERVRRIANGELGVAVYFPEHRGSVYANNTLDRAADMARDDRRTLADAYLAQQPSYAAQAAELAELRANLELQKQITSEAIDAYVRVSDQLTALRTAAAPFEDERPVDEAWCRENGFEYHEGLNLWRLEMPHGRHLEVVIDSTDDVGVYIAEQQRGGGENMARLTRGKPTIGQLNHLLAALRPGGVK